MADNTVTQKVAAILAADAVGYTRLMADDEPATIQALDAARAVFTEHVEANQGRVVDTAGDSVLAVFATTAGAVLAGVAIQASLAEANQPVPAATPREQVNSARMVTSRRSSSTRDTETGTTCKRVGWGRRKGQDGHK